MTERVSACAMYIFSAGYAHTDTHPFSPMALRHPSGRLASGIVFISMLGRTLHQSFVVTLGMVDTMGYTVIL